MSDVNLSLDLNHDNEEQPIQTASSNNTADEVICLSDSENLNRHRPMHFDMISGGFSFEQTVIIKIMNFIMGSKYSYQL